jgi:hypothetical protein
MPKRFFDEKFSLESMGWTKTMVTVTEDTLQAA